MSRPDSRTLEVLTETGIENGGGLGELKGRLWRVGPMAHSSPDENVMLLVSTLRRLLHR